MNEVLQRRGGQPVCQCLGSVDVEAGGKVDRQTVRNGWIWGGGVTGEVGSCVTGGAIGGCDSVTSLE